MPHERDGPRFIALDGIAGAGQTAQTRRLAERLQQELPDIEIVTVREPGFTARGKAITDTPIPAAEHQRLRRTINQLQNRHYRRHCTARPEDAMDPIALLHQAAYWQFQLPIPDLAGSMLAALMAARPPIPEDDYPKHMEAAAALMIHCPTPHLIDTVNRMREDHAGLSNLDILDAVAARLRGGENGHPSRFAAIQWMRHAAVTNTELQ